MLSLRIKALDVIGKIVARHFFSNKSISSQTSILFYSSLPFSLLFAHKCGENENDERHTYLRH